MENYAGINRRVLYLITEMNKHKKYFQEHGCFDILMTVIDEMQIQSIEGFNFVNILEVQNKESEEESYVEEIDEAEESEEENSEDVTFLGSNYENNENHNR